MEQVTAGSSGAKSHQEGPKPDNRGVSGGDEGQTFLGAERAPGRRCLVIAVRGSHFTFRGPHEVGTPATPISQLRTRCSEIAPARIRDTTRGRELNPGSVSRACNHRAPRPRRGEGLGVGRGPSQPMAEAPACPPGLGKRPCRARGLSASCTISCQPYPRLTGPITPPLTDEETEAQGR